jgi:hypothetical protein
MRRAVGILLLTGLLSLLVWPLPALAGHAGSAGTAASSRGVRADFNGDGTADLAIGAPGEDTARGVVQVLYGSANRLTATGNQFWTQNSPGIAGVAEFGDILGFALAAGPLSTAGGDTANPAATSPAQRNRLGRSTPG